MEIIKVYLKKAKDCIMRSFLTYTLRKHKCNDKVKEDEIDRNVAHMEEKSNAYRILVGKPEG
jgi:hypothetical protein